MIVDSGKFALPMVIDSLLPPLPPPLLFLLLLQAANVATPRIAAAASAT
jgi:hypothetical protein